ncbi:hypothetical protein FYZ48_13105 [Gimesia chilikensis]|uniref:DUF5658 family protein n=1 Tax=Gimesia chilikensis TaxID=2605989 RepID=UPI0011EDBE5F|nr:DUF5658 family protein [Gimesia chilikensis]KAA0138422.1 hypothetical protein FYZ48_13105 [Gimesia chilikensis]
MDETDPQPNENKSGRSFLGNQLPLERETCIFILVNALDVFMTYLLLVTGSFRESNQLANYFIAHWGIRGMVYFKFSLVAVVTVIAQIVARKKMETGRKLLNFGSLIVAGVVIYSFVLLMRSGYLFK